MYFKHLFARLLALSLFLILPTIVSAAANSDIYVVSMDANGSSYYMESYGDGTFSEQEFIGAPSASGLTLASGIGDFDGDRDLDYIVAKGIGTGSVFFFERQVDGSDKSFKEPVVVATWQDGLYPQGMAVADFNGDSILDFLITYYNSEDGTLYLGVPPEEWADREILEFAAPILVEGIAPQFSNNADAADLNNDGFADFVVAPAYGGFFSVNIGLDDGTFDSDQFMSYSGGNYWNIALADFNNDGNVDMIATNDNYIDFYEGQGEVEDDEPQFIWRHRIEDDNMVDSPIDNFDFDNDGNQDLIVAKYVGNTDVAVLLGEGDGKTFKLDGERYIGDEGKIFLSVAAPSVYVPANIPPVAAITVDNQGAPIIAGRPVDFDGFDSVDDDGEIVSYVWKFGSDSDPVEGITARHTFYEAGERTITLTVTDDQGESHCTQIKITVEPLPVRVKFYPRTLNLKSKGKWMMAKITLPKKLKGCGVDLTGVFTVDDDVFLGYAVEKFNYGFLSHFIRKNKKSRRTIRVLFDRQEIIQGLVDESGKVKLRVDGRIMINGKETDFSGIGKIRVKQPKPKKKTSWFSFYKKYKSSKSCKKNK